MGCFTNHVRQDRSLQDWIFSLIALLRYFALFHFYKRYDNFVMSGCFTNRVTLGSNFFCQLICLNYENCAARGVSNISSLCFWFQHSSLKRSPDVGGGVSNTYIPLWSQYSGLKKSPDPRQQYFSVYTYRVNLHCCVGKFQTKLLARLRLFCTQRTKNIT